ncbi:MAG: hypothetical protein KME54_27735 [Tolypothrix brevis GSE-NOS-MK-07-07A]|jgi:hypothetical protein|nr:hypothetical protein [Tolypothrix brevis GSE-NOS-MK-07-07A]
MRISFERSGGFAGIIKTTNIDTTTLSPNESNQVSQLIQSAGFFELPQTITSDTRSKDRFQYTLTIDDNGKQHTITIGESALSGNLKSLIEWLKNAPTQ